jgi:hypothetical protein
MNVGMARFLLGAFGLLMASCRPRDAGFAEDVAGRALAASEAGARTVAAAPPSAPPRPVSMADAYLGTIGDKARVVMRLHSTPGGLSGEYFYEAVGEALLLSGVIDVDGHVSLTERDRGGRVTGTFTGDRRSPDAIAGTWEAPGSTRRLAFELTAIARASGTGPVKVFRRAFRNQAQALDQGPVGTEAETVPTTCDIRVEYPEVFGLESALVEAKINTALGAESERACEQACEGARNYEVTFNRAGVLSIDVSGEHTCWRAAHPSNYEGFSANFLTRTGDRLTLEQVFKKPFEANTEKTFKPVIDSMMRTVQSDFAQDDAAAYRELLKTGFEAPDFALVEGGVRFSIVRSLPHAIQGIAERPSTLTFEQLAAVLDPSSPVAFLWKR